MAAFVPSAWTIPHPYNPKSYLLICKHLLALPKTEGAVRIPTTTRPTQADFPQSAASGNWFLRLFCLWQARHWPLLSTFHRNSRQCWKCHLRRRCTGMPLVTAPHVECLSLPLLNVEGKPLKARCNLFSGPSRGMWSGGAIR
ncbi:hypothetical protein IscW_ISCW007943 [Ixodes scapularis]|uniref:Uncharacterized protein n=1 Tax=Ixodes scapularis TaxID=6945 RepID=B7PRP7_IXOSC|nr:hypothetical protein IscW_ISCW007943 [Ixodes scapularis]|eukprot:XP_002400581.1 hypothetical protein IscW_ISCW007943 [Ixodes scapularis]